ncbi:MAG TPA: NADH-quinone oxidoreductase subunit C [Acidimicrobiales bacterium]
MTDTAALEEAEAQPRDEQREALLAALTNELGDALVGSHIAPGHDLWIRVTRSAWVDTFRMLRTKHRLHFFNWLSAIDWLPSPFGRELDSEVDHIVHGRSEREPEPMVAGYAGGDTRFQLIARVDNVVDHWGLFVKCDLPDDDLVVDTLVPVYAGANWHEREVHEMFGIDFAGHPDLRNLYLPTDFEGHPLRKDFPLLSRRIKPWPGIVDVEPMPGEDEGDEGGEG